MKRNMRKKGEFGEELAANFLVRNGYKILDRNYRFERAEIDLIAEDGNELVFVEVKARSSKTFGEPEDAVTEQKENQIRNAADGYLYEKNIDDRPCRFDIIAIEFRNGVLDIRHIKDAFT